MNKSSILLITTKVFLVQDLSSSTTNNKTTLCSLKWKFGIIWVGSTEKNNELAALENLQWLKQCLKHSSANLVCVDINLGETEILFWADSCFQVKKEVFVRLGSNIKRGKRQPLFSYLVKSLFDRVIAGLLLLLLSPAFLLLVLLHLKLQSSVFSKDWRIGKGGRLFQALKFRSILESIKIKEYLENKDYKILHTPTQSYFIKLVTLDKWMRQNGLDKLPQLINILWGEMSLVGPRALTLYDVIQIDSKYKYYLHSLPGIINPYLVQTNQFLSDNNKNSYIEYEYLERWNLMKDIKILFKTLLINLCSTIYFS